MLDWNNLRDIPALCFYKDGQMSRIFTKILVIMLLPFAYLFHAVICFREWIDEVGKKNL